ncbi:hypothetical protein [Aquisphaera insulae]|uniref:hypothetical protein n=1 Tax=Aquisphaera insulae TaxID=2712864 RepID=UPI0013ED897C|nr:hypothetical protein [Aquisphaera insulae]
MGVIEVLGMIMGIERPDDLEEQCVRLDVSRVAQPLHQFISRRGNRHQAVAIVGHDVPFSMHTEQPREIAPVRLDGSIHPRSVSPGEEPRHRPGTFGSVSIKPRFHFHGVIASLRFWIRRG